MIYVILKNMEQKMKLLLVSQVKLFSELDFRHLETFKKLTTQIYTSPWICVYGLCHISLLIVQLCWKCNGSWVRKCMEAGWKLLSSLVPGNGVPFPPSLILACGDISAGPCQAAPGTPACESYCGALTLLESFICCVCSKLYYSVRHASGHP